MARYRESRLCRNTRLKLEKRPDVELGARVVVRSRPGRVYQYAVRVDGRQVAEFVWHRDAMAHAQKLAAELEAK